MTTFQEYLADLKDEGRPLKATKLLHLSHLVDEEERAFLDAWPEIGIERRRQMVRQLGELAEDNVELNFDAIFLACLSDADPEVRAVAIRGLWEYEQRDLIERLIGLLQSDDSAFVRAEAALALGRFVLQCEFGSLPDRYFRQVEQALRRTIDDEGQELEVRGRALEAIGACSLPWVREAIDRAYRSDNQRLRVSGIHAMGRNCDPSWLPILFEELKSEDPEMRYEAALACGLLAEEAAVLHLAPLLEDEDIEVREVTIAALGEIGGRQARAVLLRYLEGPSQGMREAVEEALSVVDFTEDPLSFSP
ncbi:MAG: HEAT repeat domain-containing protein [Dehalococcoidia bacterium]|nr:MAG: HEAT repeat domain-containing protein [Dehalococcoidia bacterium]